MKEFWIRFFRNRAAVLGLSILGFVILLAILGPLFYPDSPFKLVGHPMTAPCRNFPLGTDSLGRDVAAGIAYGAQTSLFMGLIASIVTVLLGILVGGLAGYYGSWIDQVLMRFTEIFQTIPTFIFAILLVAIMTPSIVSVIIAIVVVSWSGIARLVRGEFKSLRNREFIQASVCLGMNDIHIMLFHILPNCLSSIIVTGSLMVANAILIESGLSFLGLGDPNKMSWGFLVGSGRSFLRQAWWISTFPGITILLTVLAINLVGDGFNDAFNPRLRNR
jgi:peptide/nickel transport system permease protein